MLVCPESIVSGNSSNSLFDTFLQVRCIMEFRFNLPNKTINCRHGFLHFTFNMMKVLQENLPKMISSKILPWAYSLKKISKLSWSTWAVFQKDMSLIRWQTSNRLVILTLYNKLTIFMLYAFIWWWYHFFNLPEHGFWEV